MAGEESGGRSQPKDVIGGLVVDARALRDDYESAVKTHLTNARGMDFLSALLSFEDLSDVLYEDWEQTGSYRQLRGRFDRLLDRATTSLESMVGKGGRDSRGALRPVVQAVRLDTKIRRLIVTLEGLQTQPVHYRLEGARVTERTTRRPRSKRKGSYEAEAWALVAVGVSILGVAAPLGVLAYGWLLGIVFAGILTLVGLLLLVLSRRWWIPHLARVFSRPPK